MRKKIALAVTAVAVATSLTACGGAGNDAPTRMINQVTDGVEAKLASDDNLIVLRNIQVAVNLYQGVESAQSWIDTEHLVVDKSLCSIFNKMF